MSYFVLQIDVHQKAAGYGFTIREKMTIGQVRRGSAAEEAGLRVNDRILSINNVKMEKISYTEAAQLFKLVAICKSFFVNCDVYCDFFCEL